MEKFGFTEATDLTQIGEITPERSPFYDFCDTANDSPVKVLEDFGMNTSEAWDDLTQKVGPKV